MRDATHETSFGENKKDIEYPAANVEISKEQIFIEVLRTVRERARLRERKYPTVSRWKRIIPNRSCLHTVGDEDADQRNARHFANDRMIDAVSALTSASSRSQGLCHLNAQKPRLVSYEGRSRRC